MVICYETLNISLEFLSLFEFSRVNYKMKEQNMLENENNNNSFNECRRRSMEIVMNKGNKKKLQETSIRHEIYCPS